MKNVLLTSSKARSIAEARWGTGGTHAHKQTPNRKGIYYFSCSGHGGYVVDANALTEEEYNEIIKYVRPTLTTVIYRSESGKLQKMLNPHSGRGGKYTPYSDTVIDSKYELFMFEEDCDWSVLEHVTGIRDKEQLQRMGSEMYDKAIEDSMNRWHYKKVA